MKIMIALVLGAAALMSQVQGSPDRYSEGQVWEYRTRPSDAGSLTKIQRIEPMPGGSPGERIYQVSIIGVRLVNSRVSPVLPHLPVTRETLDQSVTRQVPGSGDFPEAAQVEEGVASWREAQGGVFTISLAQIVDFVDAQVAQVPLNP